MCIYNLEHRYYPENALVHFMEIKALILTKPEFNYLNRKVSTSKKSVAIAEHIVPKSTTKVSTSKKSVSIRANTGHKSTTKQSYKLKCSKLKKTVNPKCEQQSHCQWITNKGCKDKKNNAKVVLKKPKKCVQGKVFNPKSGRCINKNGATAKKLRKAGIIN